MTTTSRILEEPQTKPWHEQPFTLSNCMKASPKVFEQGEEDCKRFVENGEPGDHKTNSEYCNPYPQGSTQFYCWNRGWNFQMGKEIDKSGLTKRLKTLTD